LGQVAYWLYGRGPYCSMSAIVCHGLSTRYGTLTAVHHLEMTVPRGPLALVPPLTGYHHEGRAIKREG
jgi:hypothetical protein